MLEVDRRTDAFDGPNSVRVVLADGQEWWLQKPYHAVQPVFKGGKATHAFHTISYGPELDALLDAIADGRLEPVSGAASVAAELLGRQYRLTDAELDSLLAFQPDDTESAGWIRHVMSVATGEYGLVKPTDSE